jgi:hypothetical protein
MTIDGSLLLQEEREKKGATCCLHSGRNLAEKLKEKGSSLRHIDIPLLHSVPASHADKSK